MILVDPPCKKCGATRSLMKSGEWRCKPCQAEYSYRKYHEDVEESRKRCRESYQKTKSRESQRRKLR